MAAKKRKLEITEDDLIANRIDGIEWKPLELKSVNKISSEYLNPCSFMDAYHDGKPLFLIKCTTPKCAGNGKKEVYTQKIPPKIIKLSRFSLQSSRKEVIEAKFSHATCQENAKK